MSGISGNSGAARRAIHEFDEALDDASAPDTTSKAKVSKSEMREALKELAPVQGNLTARTRNDIWAKINEHQLTPTARKLAEETVGPAPAVGPAPGTGLPREGAKLAKHLETLAKDLTFMSESDYPFKGFSRPLAAGTRATDADLRKAVGLSANAPLDRSDLADWFQGMQDPDVISEPADRAKFKALEAAMKAGLKDLEMIYEGPDDKVEAKVFIVGRAPDGSIVGLKSTRIWT